MKPSTEIDNAERTRRTVRNVIFVLLAFFTFIACAVTNTIDTPPMSGEVYFVCITATPVPTEQYIKGTSVPDPDAPPVPPNVTVEPGIDYGYTTPVPTETPYYRVGTFFVDQIVQTGGIEIMLDDFGQIAIDQENELAYYEVKYLVTNRTSVGKMIPLSELTFIRRVFMPDGEVKIGRWTARLSKQLQASEVAMLGVDETRTYTVVYTIPLGSSIKEIGLITNWQSNLEAGVPVWFLTKNDDVWCRESATWQMGAPPPPPTPAIVGLRSSGGSSGGVAGTGICGWPLTAVLVRGWGCSAFQTGITDPMGCSGGTPYFHNGIDLGATEGTVVVSPINGTASVGTTSVRGNFVLVSGNNGERHDLLHLSSQSVTDGETVVAGQQVGGVGSTGNSTGNHLHWTVRVNGVAINPDEWGGCTAE